MEASPDDKQDFIRKYWYWIALGAILLLIALLRIRLLGFPLERDEGEYAFSGQQILNGVMPFKEYWNMKFPGTYFAYAFIMAIFGQTEDGIHVGLMLTNLLTTFFLFLLAKKISGNLGGVVASLFWGIISFSPGVYGFAAHATQFVALFSVAGFYLLYRAVEEKKNGFFLWAGLLLGIGTLMKQSGAVFPLLALGWLLWLALKEKKIPLSDPLKFAGGFFIPVLLMFISFVALGSFKNFWFWTFVYAREYGTQTSLSEGADNLLMNFKTVLKGFNLFWIFFLPGLASVFFLKGENSAVKKGITLILFAAGFAGIFPGLYFRPHYFVTLIPGLSICAGILFQVAWENLPESISEKIKLIIFPAVLAGLTAITLFANSPYFFTKSPDLLCRQDIYAGDIFADSKPIANYIHTRTNERDKILIFGSEPQILFYAQRPSAVGFLYTYPLMENHPFAYTMQKEYSRKVQEILPKFFIFVMIPESWTRRPESNPFIFDWAAGFLDKYYKQVGLAEVYANKTIYYWDEEADGRQPETQNAVMIMQMKY